MKLLVFERTSFEISEKNNFRLSVTTISESEFIHFIDFLVDKSKAFKTYINVYKILQNDSLQKLAFIKCGDLYTQ